MRGGRNAEYATPLEQARATADIRTFARGGSLAVAGFAVGSLLQLLVVVVLTRGLDAGSAGTLLATIALFTILSSAGTLGADVGVVRQIPMLLAGGRAFLLRRLLAIACTPVAAIGILVALATLLAAGPLAELLFDSLHREEGSTYLRIVAPALPVAALTTVVLAATRGFGTMVPYVGVLNLVIPGLRLGLILAAFGAGFTGAGIAVGWTVPLAIGAVVAFLSLRRLVLRAEEHGRFTQTAGAGQVGIGEFWRFAAPRAIASVFEITVLSLDILLVAALRSPGEAAVYAAASRLVVFGTYLLSTVSRPLAPQLSGLLASRQLDVVGALYHIATWWGMIVAWPIYITWAIFAEPLMRLFGSAYATGSTTLVILSLAYLFHFATGNTNVLLLMSGRSSLNLVNATLALGLNIGLNLLLIPPLGIEGAALAWAVSIVAHNLAALVEIRVLFGLSPLNAVYPIVIAATILSFGVVGACARLLIGNSGTSLIFAAAVGSIVYGLLLWHWRSVLRLHDFASALRPRPDAA